MGSDERAAGGLTPLTDLSGSSITVCDDRALGPEDRSAQGAAQLERGATLGRYVVLATVGSGGMGVVYEAYDPELDRRLAVKLLHPRRSRAHSKAKAEEYRARLLREAQAMARVTHPNVIAVHDVGTHESGVFVAMEFVEGQTLRLWLELERPWREVLQTFVSAGRGLEAAHRAGLVHRDFKPDNVMVGSDGRVAVMDFGLARATGEEEDDTGAGEDADDPLASGAMTAFDTELTHDGAVMGTPAYMSPEQHLGVGADARSDQFSFCVSLWEAVYRQRPFRGETRHALALQTTEGALVEPPRDTDVPTPLRRILERGLSASAGDRWPSMDALVRQLARAASPPTRRPAWIAASLLAGIGTAIGVAALVGDSQDVCEGGARKLEGVWDESTKAEIRESLLATGKNYAQASWDAVERSVDAYTEAWLRSHRKSCEATRVYAEQSERLMDLRMACLERRVGSLSSVTELLRGADDGVLEHATHAVDALPPIQPCDQLTDSSLALPGPGSDNQAASVAEAREQLDHARALASAGKLGPGLDEAQSADDRAGLIEYLPLRAETRLTMGVLLAENGHFQPAREAFEQAIQFGEVAHHDEARADAWAQLVWTIGLQLGEPSQALELLPLAEAVTERLGPGHPRRGALLAKTRASLLRRLDRLDEAIEVHAEALELYENAYGPEHRELASLLVGHARLLSRKGEHEQALEILARARDILESQLGPDHPDLAEVFKVLGGVHGAMGDDDQALALHRRAVSIRQTGLGEDHPSTAHAHNDLGNRLEQIGRYEEALVELNTALSIKERLLGKEHSDLATTLNNLGNAYHNMGRHEDAVQVLQRAIEINERSLGKMHASVAFNRQNLGNAFRSLGDLEAARTEYDHALEIKREVLGSRHASVGGTLNNLGNLHVELGLYDRARQLFEEALDIKRAGLTERHPRLGSTLKGLGELELDHGDPARGLALLEEALQIREQHSTGATTLAGTRFAVARALWVQGGDRARARRLARQASEVYQSSADVEAEEKARLEAWLVDR